MHSVPVTWVRHLGRHCGHCWRVSHEHRGSCIRAPEQTKWCWWCHSTPWPEELERWSQKGLLMGFIIRKLYFRRQFKTQVLQPEQNITATVRQYTEIEISIFTFTNMFSVQGKAGNFAPPVPSCDSTIWECHSSERNDSPVSPSYSISPFRKKVRLSWKYLFLKFAKLGLERQLRG